MTKNHWTKQIYFKKLNKSLFEMVKNYLGQPWTADLKKTISKLALKFMNEHNLADDTAFAVILEKVIPTGILGATDLFRDIKLVI